MKTNLDMRRIFRCMMEEGLYPKYETTHITFNLDDNIAVVEYEEGILSIRVFFSIDEDTYDLFLEASNSTMTETFIVKPAILDDMKHIMFSCEIMCDNIRELRKFLPRGLDLIRKSLSMHKTEMKELILAENVSSAAISAAEDTFLSSSKAVKPLS